MDIVRSEQSRKLLGQVLQTPGDENLVNASFMLSPIQVQLIRQLASDNRYLNSQGAVLRYIIDDWARHQLEGCKE
jgi:hypothetical protein